MTIFIIFMIFITIVICILINHYRTIKDINCTEDIEGELIKEEEIEI
jgi:hypothetical protein